MSKIRIGEAFRGENCFGCRAQELCEAGSFVVLLSDHTKQKLAGDLFGLGVSGISATAAGLETAKANYQVVMKAGNRFMHKIVEVENQSSRVFPEGDNFHYEHPIAHFEEEAGELPPDQKDPELLSQIKNDVINFATKGVCTAIEIQKLPEDPQPVPALATAFCGNIS